MSNLKKIEFSFIIQIRNFILYDMSKFKETRDQ